jgi:hypothetical protein
MNLNVSDSLLKLADMKSSTLNSKKVVPSRNLKIMYGFSFQK